MHADNSKVGTSAPAQSKIPTSANDDCIEKPFTNEELENHFNELYHHVNLAIDSLRLKKLSGTDSIEYVLVGVCGLLDQLYDRAKELSDHENRKTLEDIRTIMGQWKAEDKIGKRLIRLLMETVTQKAQDETEQVAAMMKRYGELRKNPESVKEALKAGGVA